jgi:nudix-type nucleoside diphosphatase (YffH/AdpP family)
MSKKVIIYSRNRLLDKSFRVEEAKVSYERFDGSMSIPVTRLSFERGDSVAAIVFNKDNQSIILVNQFRYPAYQKGPGWITEAVAGILEGGENAEDAVRREVLEEIGYKVETVEPIAEFYVSPGGTSERILLYYAEVVNAGKVGRGGGKPGENEDISVQEFPIRELNNLIAKGSIQDAKTLIGLMWLQRRISRAFR